MKGTFLAVIALSFLLISLMAIVPSIPKAQAGTFPGVNGKIAFTREGEIYTMNADGTDVKKVISNIYDDGEPSWSPDGSKIAFISLSDGDFEIYVMNADGTDVKKVTNNIGGDFEPSWSPDGTKIAFESNREGANLHVYVINADGTGETILANTEYGDFEPSWSPDGSKIAFVSDREGWNSIYVINPDGTGLKALPTDLSDARAPSWSPDGTKIAFTNDKDIVVDDIVGNIVNLEIYVMNADGSGQINLTNSPGATGDMWPSWSPDGSKIVFSSNRDGNWEIYIMNSDGTNQTRLTNSPAYDGLPDFGPAPSDDSSTSNVGLFVVPESPIGTLALMLSSIAALTTFVIFKSHKMKK